MATLIFSDRYRASFLPSHWSNLLATRLRSIGINSVAISQFSAFSLSDFDAVAQTYCAPDVEAIVVDTDIFDEHFSALTPPDFLAFAERLAILSKRKAAKAVVYVVGPRRPEALEATPEISVLSRAELVPILLKHYGCEALYPGSLDAFLNVRVDWWHKDLVLGNSAVIELSPIPCSAKCALCPHGRTCNWQRAVFWDNTKRLAGDLSRELSKNHDMHGITNYALLDFLTDESDQKARDFAAAVAQSGVKAKFIAHLRLDSIANQPAVLEHLLEAGVIGCILEVDSMDERNRRLLGYRKAESVSLLEKIRAVTGSEFFIDARLISGLPFDTEESLHQGSLLLGGKTSNRLVDRYEYQPLRLEPASPLLGSGMYVHNIDAEKWCSGSLTYGSAERIARTLNNSFEATSAAHSLWTSVFDFLSTSNLGVPILDAMRLYRGATMLDKSVTSRLMKTMGEMKRIYIQDYASHLVLP